MFCNQCGEEQRENAKFCHECGALLSSAPITTEKLHVDKEHGMRQAVVIGDPPSPYAKYFYAVPTSKFLTLSVLTFGLYIIYWFAMNWGLIQKQEKSKISPVGRAIFAILYYSGMASKVLRAAKEKHYQDNFSPTTLAILFFVTSLLYRAPGNYFLLGLTSILCLLPVVNAINYCNEKENKPINSAYGPGSIVAVVIGVAVWLLLLLAMLEESTSL